jgi:hypothetical protein
MSNNQIAHWSSNGVITGNQWLTYDDQTLTVDYQILVTGTTSFPPSFSMESTDGLSGGRNWRWTAQDKGTSYGSLVLEAYSNDWGTADPVIEITADVDGLPSGTQFTVTAEYFNHNSYPVITRTSTPQTIEGDLLVGGSGVGVLTSGHYFQPRTTTTTALEDITDAINTNNGKIQGSMVYNATTDCPVWATGAASGDVWVDGTGSTVHTPV